MIVEDSGGLNLGPATLTLAGVIRLATEAEALAKERSDVAMSPATTAALLIPATSEEVGLVRLATEDEASDSRNEGVALTPATMATVLPDLLRSASTTEAGVIRVATLEEIEEGVAENVAVPPAALTLLNEAVPTQTVVFGDVQLTEFINELDGELDYTVPPGAVMVGINSVHDDRTEDRRFRIRYQQVSLANA